jgi:hypothetical protein
MNDKEVIEAFISHLRKGGYADLRIDNRPDEGNRKTSDVDAIAGPFAIEHTSIDTVSNQRRDSDWFLKAVGGLESEFINKLQYRLNITIPYEGVQLRQNWSGIRQAFRSWITDHSANLTDGVHTITDEPGIPFRFIVKKQTGRSPRLIFARTAPTDNSLPDRIRKLFVKKAQKLMSYKQGGYISILLVESDDIALMNEGIMIEAIRVGLSRSLPDGIDRLWYVDTAIPEEVLFYDFTEAVHQ